MILLADGGSTKVDWRLVDNGRQTARVFTKGMNPFFRSGEEMSEEIQASVMPVVEGCNIEAVHFFGAGCASPELNKIVGDAISKNINTRQVTVDSDLLAAAKALCGKDVGIACILGTGSNSCYYDGEKIRQQVSPLGYILGDEGSGAVLGKIFLGACLKNQLTDGIKEKFLEEINLTPLELLDKVYKQPMPNRFLAGLSPFLANNIGDESIYKLVYSAFSDFFGRNVMQYDYRNNEVHFTGSVAYHYSEILRRVGTDLGINIGKIEQSPMEGLIRYYTENE